VLYGDTWLAAGRPAQILAIGCAIASLFNLAGTTLLSLGGAKLLLKSQLTVQAFRLMAVALACLHSIEAVAVALVLTNVVGLFTLTRYLRLAAGIRFSDLTAAVTKSGAVTLMALVVPVILVCFAPPHESTLAALLLLAAALAGAISGWLLGVHLAGHPVEVELTHALRALWATTTRHSRSTAATSTPHDRPTVSSVASVRDPEPE
jgi:hypothetical protein